MDLVASSRLFQQRCDAIVKNKWFENNFPKQAVQKKQKTFGYKINFSQALTQREMVQMQLHKGKCGRVATITIEDG